MFAKPKRLIASIATATLLLATAAYAATYTFPRSGNSPPTAAEMNSQMGAGTFTTSSDGSNVWSSGGSRLIKRSEFVANVNNNGSCATGNNSQYYVMTQQDMINCRVVTSSLGAITDPWFVSGTANWPVVSGSPTFTLIPGGAYPNEASGAQYVTGTAVIQQAISPNPIAAGTQIVARADLSANTASGDGTNTTDICGDTGTAASATGTGSIQIVRADGVVMSSQGAAGPGTSVATTANQTTGYYVRITVASASATYVTWATRGTGDTATCASTTHTVTGTAQATNVSVANS